MNSKIDSINKELNVISVLINYLSIHKKDPNKCVQLTTSEYDLIIKALREYGDNLI